jgi:hypothetical protein
MVIQGLLAAASEQTRDIEWYPLTSHYMRILENLSTQLSLALEGSQSLSEALGEMLSSLEDSKR